MKTIDLTKAQKRWIMAAVSKDPCRESLTKPFAIKFRGGRWMIGTDGHRLHAVRVDSETTLGHWDLDQGPVTSAPVIDPSNVIPGAEVATEFNGSVLKDIASLKPLDSKFGKIGVCLEKDRAPYIASLVSNGKPPMIDESHPTCVWPPYLKQAIAFCTEKTIKTQLRGPLESFMVTAEDNNALGWFAVVMPVRSFWYRESLR